MPAQALCLVQRCFAKQQITQVTQPPTAQIWCPVTSGCSQNLNHLWPGRDLRPSMRFRKILWGSWWWLGELCESPVCLLWRQLRHHCPMYNVSCIFNKCLYLSYYIAGYFMDKPHKFLYLHVNVNKNINKHPNQN